MKCSYCGTELSGQERFCRFCGTRQEIKQPEPAPAFQTVPATEAVPQPVPAAESVPESTPVPMVPPAMEEQMLSWQNEEEPKFDFEKEPGYVPLQPRMPSQPVRPMIQLPTGRGLAKFFFLGLITLGIYPIVILSRIVTELNIAASRYDGERTVSYFGAGMLASLTLGIYAFVWIHGFCRRIGHELRRRNIAYEFGAKHFWLWGMLGSLIIAGPFVFVHKLMKAMNLINADFNING